MTQDPEGLGWNEARSQVGALFTLKIGQQSSNGHVALSGTGTEAPLDVHRFKVRTQMMKALEIPLHICNLEIMLTGPTLASMLCFDWSKKLPCVWGDRVLPGRVCRVFSKFADCICIY